MIYELAWALSRLLKLEPLRCPNPEKLNIAGHNIDRETLSSVLRDPSIALPRKGRPRGTRRLQTSAENILNATDRRVKVRRCGSCHQAGHNRRRCPKF
ncbi:hypothetical protein V1527DRAFT_477312 [Lipomyces starkeyi]